MKTLFALLLVSFALTTQAQITSTFDTDAEGWTFTSVSTSITVNHQTSGGNPGSYVSATYSSNASATVQNWIAPAKFRGNQLLRSLGMQLKFDLQQSQAGTGAGYDVLIRNGGNFIYLSGITPKPAVAPAWTSYSFTLDETGGWYYSSGA
ncbi:MAG TPA: laminin B domain-containing protein, partial [Chryseolinea sp.]|nr:laminin B domain-containing protein [Chryseolinea sp.]